MLWVAKSYGLSRWPAIHGVDSHDSFRRAAGNLEPVSVKKAGGGLMELELRFEAFLEFGRP